MVKVAAPREIGMLFQQDMVRALAEGRKTQTRRLVKNQPQNQGGGVYHRNGTRRIGTSTNQRDSKSTTCPYRVGDRIWVRETFYCDDYRYPDAPHEELLEAIEYRASHVCGDWEAGCPCTERCWMPSIHMPRWASRFTLEITEVRVERVQAITFEDACDEGIERVPQLGILRSSGWRDYSGETPGFLNPVESYRTLWDSIEGEGVYRWSMNPWVWALTFNVLGSEA